MKKQWCRSVTIYLIARRRSAESVIPIRYRSGNERVRNDDQSPATLSSNSQKNPANLRTAVFREVPHGLLVLNDNQLGLLWCGKDVDYAMHSGYDALHTVSENSFDGIITSCLSILHE